MDRFLQTRYRRIACYSMDIECDAIVVTGGTGCIGTALIALIRRDTKARVFSISRRLPTPAQRVPGVTYLSEDVRDLDSMIKIFNEVRPRLLVHLAAQRDPGLAEQNVYETISINVLGTIAVLSAAAECKIPLVSSASSGKALRYYSSDIYAATKVIAEYVVARAAEKFEFGAICARFTHVVDNSIVFSRLNQWAKGNEPILLHGAELAFYVQSALECAQLLMIGATEPFQNGAGVIALRNLGWPPIELLQLAREVVAFYRSSSRIEVVGFDPGYEERSYPTTYDPLTAGEVSPLMNALEAPRVRGVDPFVAVVDGVAMPGTSDAVDYLLEDLVRMINVRAGPQELRKALHEISRELLVHRLNRADWPDSNRLRDRSSTMLVETADHVVISETLARWRNAGAD
jgi:nucleoside-diphosphate-sugar epimerase